MGDYPAIGSLWAAGAEGYAEAQRRVFDALGLSDVVELRQIEMHITSYAEDPVAACLGPANSLGAYVQSCTEDVICLMDIDAIPLRPRYFLKVLQRAAEIDGFVGIRQRRPGKRLRHLDYMGHAFMVFTRAAYERIGSPTFNERFPKYDIGGYITGCCREVGQYFEFLDPIHADEVLPHHTTRTNGKRGVMAPWGLGTTYDGVVYHAFWARDQRTLARFRKRCDEVIDAHSRQNTAF